MPSPFPGMDPYLERTDLWPDFHNNLAPVLQELLNRQVQPRYVARLTAYTVFDAVEIGRPQVFYPDVRVTQVQPPRGAVGVAVLDFTPATTTTSNPVEAALRLTRVEVRAVAEQRLVAVIEILSPVNKRRGSDSREEYLRKRRELLRSSVHLIEIDLLRGGERVPLDPPPSPTPYTVVISPGDRRPRADVWSIGLADRLPVLPIPLLAPDPPVPLDLGRAVRMVYDRAGYASDIDYRQPPPPPPLTAEEAAWLDELLRDLRQSLSSATPAAGETNADS